MLRQFQPPRDAVNMRIHDQTFSFAEPGPQHDICSLPRYARQSEQLVNVLRDFAPEFVHNSPRRANHRFRFVAEEACRTYVWFELLRFEPGNILHCWILLE